MSLDEIYDKNRKKPLNVRAVFDVVMGLIYAGVGAVLLLAKQIGLELTFPPPEVVSVFGVFCVLYGLFRVYRGVQSYKAS